MKLSVVFFVLFQLHHGFAAQEGNEIELILKRLSEVEKYQTQCQDDLSALKEIIVAQQQHITAQQQRIVHLESHILVTTEGRPTESKLNTDHIKQDVTMKKEHSLKISDHLDNQTTSKPMTQILRTIKRNNGGSKRILVGDGSVHNFIGFSARLSSNLAHLTTDHIIPFKTVLFNEGNGYNGSDGIFIPPRAGVYFFTWNIMVQGGWDAYVKLVINGSLKMHTAVTTNNGYADASNFLLARLNAGDHVWLAIYTGDCELNNQSTFTGFMVST